MLGGELPPNQSFLGKLFYPNLPVKEHAFLVDASGIVTLLEPNTPPSAYNLTKNLDSMTKPDYSLSLSYPPKSTGQHLCYRHMRLESTMGENMFRLGLNVNYYDAEDWETENMSDLLRGTTSFYGLVYLSEKSLYILDAAIGLDSGGHPLVSLLMDSDGRVVSLRNYDPQMNFEVSLYSEGPSYEIIDDPELIEFAFRSLNRRFGEKVLRVEGYNLLKTITTFFTDPTPTETMDGILLPTFYFFGNGGPNPVQFYNSDNLI